MSWLKIKEVLPQKVDSLRLRAQIDGAEVCKLWQAYADKLLSQSINENHEAINFRDGVLIISVAHPIYLSEIRSQQFKIISLVNKALGHTLIKKVKYFPS